MGSRVPLREHLPDGEVHWPDRGTDRPPGTDGTAPTPARPTAGPAAAHRLGRGMLGHRGGAHPQDGAPDRGDHGRDPDPDRGLRLPGGGGPGARRRRRGTRGCCTSARPRPGPAVSRAREALPARWPPGSRSAACPRRRTRRRRAPGRPREAGDVIRRWHTGFLLVRGTARRIIWRARCAVTVFVAALIAGRAGRRWSPGTRPRWPGYSAGRRASCTARRRGACRWWRRGWPRGRARHAVAAGGRPPYLAWLAMWHDVVAGGYLLAAVTIAPAAIPLGLAGRRPGLVLADLRAWRRAAAG